MSINYDLLDELEGKKKPTLPEYFTPPSPKKSSGINYELLEAMEKGESPEVIENKAQTVFPKGTPELLQQAEDALSFLQPSPPVEQHDGNQRADGTQKGLGYFGPLKRPDGQVSTELSIGVEFDGKETEIPTLVPTLTEQERNSLLSGGEISQGIKDKAVEHATSRMKQGKSPFAQKGEQQPLDPSFVEPSPKKSSGINYELLEAMEKGESPEVIENKAQTVFPKATPELLQQAEGALGFLQTGPSPELLRQAEQSLNLAPPLPGPQIPPGTPQDIKPQWETPWLTREEFAALREGYKTGQIDEGKALRGKELKEVGKRLEYYVSYIFTLGGKVGGVPKDYKQMLLEESKEFTGIGGIVVPALTEANLLAFEWGYLYPQMFKMVGITDKAIANLPKVKEATKLLQKLGGIEKLAEKFPKTMKITKDTINSARKGAEVFGLISAAEVPGKEMTKGEAAKHIGKGAGFGAIVAGTFSLVSAADKALWVKEYREGLIKRGYEQVKTEFENLRSGYRIVDGKKVFVKGTHPRLQQFEDDMLRAVDKIVGAKEAELYALTEADLYKNIGGNKVESPDKAAARFQWKGYERGRKYPEAGKRFRKGLADRPGAPEAQGKVDKPVKTKVWTEHKPPKGTKPVKTRTITTPEGKKVKEYQIEVRKIKQYPTKTSGKKAPERPAVSTEVRTETGRRVGDFPGEISEVPQGWTTKVTPLEPSGKVGTPEQVVAAGKLNLKELIEKGKAKLTKGGLVNPETGLVMTPQEVYAKAQEPTEVEKIEQKRMEKKPTKAEIRQAAIDKQEAERMANRKAAIEKAEGVEKKIDKQADIFIEQAEIQKTVTVHGEKTLQADERTDSQKIANDAFENWKSLIKQDLEKFAKKQGFQIGTISRAGTKTERVDVLSVDKEDDIVDSITIRLADHTGSGADASIEIQSWKSDLETTKEKILEMEKPLAQPQPAIEKIRNKMESDLRKGKLDQTAIDQQLEAFDKLDKSDLSNVVFKAQSFVDEYLGKSLDRNEEYYELEDELLAQPQPAIEKAESQEESLKNLLFNLRRRIEPLQNKIYEGQRRIKESFKGKPNAGKLAKKATFQAVDFLSAEERGRYDNIKNQIDMAVYKLSDLRRKAEMESREKEIARKNELQKKRETDTRLKERGHLSDGYLEHLDEWAKENDLEISEYTSAGKDSQYITVSEINPDFTRSEMLKIRLSGHPSGFGESKMFKQGAEIDTSDLRIDIIKEVEDVIEAYLGHKPPTLAQPQPAKGEVEVFHGKFAKTKTGKEFGGLHVGTEKAANKRLDDVFESNRASIGPKGAEELLGGRQIEKLSLRKTDVAFIDEPISEVAVTEDSQGNKRGSLKEFEAIPERTQALKKQGFKALAYTNIKEDPGSISFLVFDKTAIAQPQPAKGEVEGGKQPFEMTLEEFKKSKPKSLTITSDEDTKFIDEALRQQLKDEGYPDSFKGSGVFRLPDKPVYLYRGVSQQELDALELDHTITGGKYSVGYERYGAQYALEPESAFFAAFHDQSSKGSKNQQKYIIVIDGRNRIFTHLSLFGESLPTKKDLATQDISTDRIDEGYGISVAAYKDDIISVIPIGNPTTTQKQSYEFKDQAYEIVHTALTAKQSPTIAQPQQAKKKPDQAKIDRLKKQKLKVTKGEKKAKYTFFELSEGDKITAISPEDGKKYEATIMAGQKFKHPSVKHKDFEGKDRVSVSWADGGKQIIPIENIVSNKRLDKVVKPEAAKATEKQPKAPQAAKKQYTGVPKEWLVGTLYDWGQKGLRGVKKGEPGIKVPGQRTRKTFQWRNEFEEVPTRLPKAMKAFKAKTDEIFIVKRKKSKGGDYYLVPTQVVAEVKKELGKEAFERGPERKPTDRQLITYAIQSMEVKGELSPGMIGEAVLDMAKEFGLTKDELTDNQKKYVKEYEDEVASGTISEDLEESGREEVAEGAEKRAIQEEEARLDKILEGDFLEGLYDEETTPQTIKQQIQQHSNIPEEEIDAYVALIEANAEVRGVTLEEWVERYLRGIQSGVEPGSAALMQTPYSELTGLRKKGVDEYLAKMRGGKQLKRNLDRLAGTAWEKSAIEGVLIRADLDELLAGNDPKYRSYLNAPGSKRVRDMIKGQGKDGVWNYLLSTKDGFIGHPEKPGNAINASYLNCNPSKLCANTCYAVTGRNFAVVLVKMELVNWAIETDPVRAATYASRQYKATAAFEADKALRIFDKGEGNMRWMPFIKAMNGAGIRLQIFSKKPAFLRKITGQYNVNMLSIDSSNYALAKKNLDMPMAFLYSGAQDIPFIEENKGRFKKYGGVILPIRLKGGKLLHQEDLDAIPDWAKKYTCPVDNGTVSIKGLEGWRCTRCDKSGGIGCFYGKVTKKVQESLATPLSEFADLDERTERLKELLKGLDDVSRQQLLRRLDYNISQNDKGIAVEGEDEDYTTDRGLSETILYQQQEAQPIWYSKLQNAIESKMPKSMPVKQFQGWIGSYKKDKKGNLQWVSQFGIKPEEMEESGLNTLIDYTLTEGFAIFGEGTKITKKDVLQTIAANNIQIEEVVKGGRQTNEFTIYDSGGDEVEVGFDTYQDAEIRMKELLKEFPKDTFYINKMSGEATKFHDQAYNLPGGKNYRELLLRLPDAPTTEQIKPDNKALAKYAKEWNSLLEDHTKVADSPSPHGQSTRDQIEDAMDDLHRKMVQETALRLPPRRRQAPYRGGHWDESNVLAHIRMNDREGEVIRKPGGPTRERILHIEEIQSDMKQKWRKLKDAIDKGVATEWDKDEFAKLDKYPFSKTWHKLAFKRILRYAAEHGYDKLTWTTGEQQTQRYDLSKQVSEINVTTTLSGDYRMSYITSTGTHQTDQMLDIPENKLEDYVGKDLAKRIVDDFSKIDTLPEHLIVRQITEADYPVHGMFKSLAQEYGEYWGIFNKEGHFVSGASTEEGAVKHVLSFANRTKTYKGEDLKVGGEGMKGFYDVMLPRFANEYTKKWGGKVGETKIETGKRSTPSPIADNYSNFEITKEGDGYLVSGTHDATGYKRGIGFFDHKTVADDFVKEMTKRRQAPTDVSVHSLDITPKMREEVLKGQPLFQKNKAAVEFDEDGKAILYLFEGADISSLVHETAHIFRRQLDAEDLAELEKWANVKNGIWTVKAEEKFARAFEKYLRKGQAPSEKLKGVFEKFKQWLTDIYRSITGKSPLNVKITPAVKNIFDRLLSKEVQRDYGKGTTETRPGQADTRTTRRTDVSRGRRSREAAKSDTEQPGQVSGPDKSKIAIVQGASLLPTPKKRDFGKYGVSQTTSDKLYQEDTGISLTKAQLNWIDWAIDPMRDYWTDAEEARLREGKQYKESELPYIKNNMLFLSPIAEINEDLIYRLEEQAPSMADTVSEQAQARTATKLAEQIKAHKPRDKDLLGREELQGGTTGKQKEMFDKEDFLTLESRKKINAKKDIEGQQTLFQAAVDPLDENQKLGINLALDSLEKGETFLLADGTGFGKTRQMLVVAKEMQDSTNKPALIITESKKVIKQQFIPQSKALGMNLSDIEVGTYDDLRTGKIGKGDYSVVVFDEAHNLKNIQSKKTIASKQIKTDTKLFATATPMDSPTAASYFLAEISGLSQEEVRNRLGFHLESFIDARGQEQQMAVLNEGNNWADVVDHVIDMRDTAISAGRMIRRELPFRGSMEEKRVTLPGDFSAREGEIFRHWEAKIKRTRSKRMKMNLGGQRTGELSRYTESRKVMPVFEAVINDLQEGKKVIVVAEGVKLTKIKALNEFVPGFIGQFADMLTKAGYDHAKIYGPGDKAKEVERFQDDEVQIAVMTPQSGGTGIDLDDSIGDNPRTMYVVTANYSGDKFDQILGRISRRNTKSDNTVHMVQTASISDRKRQEILNRKLKTLKAIQRGVDLDRAAGFEITDEQGNREVLYQEETPKDVQDILTRVRSLAPLTVTKDTRDAENLLNGYFAEHDEKEFEAFVQTLNWQGDLKEAMGQKRYGQFNKHNIEMDKAIQVYIDLKNNPDQMKYLGKLSEPQKRIVELAQDLPPKVEAIAKDVIAKNKQIGLEALDVGVINNVMENYSMRLWETEDSIRSMYRKFGTKTARAKHRTLEGILHGWSLGKELKIKGAFSAHMVMRTQVSSTIVDRQLLKTAKQWGLISNERLEGWVLVEHPNFTDWRWAGKAEKAKTYGRNFFVTKKGNLMERVPMYATPELGKHLNNALGTSKLYAIPGVQTVTEYNAMLKRWILFTSFFHHQAYVRSYDLGGRTGFKNLSPRKAYLEGRKAIENFTPELRRGVRNGLTLGKIQDYDESVLKGKKTVWGKMARKVKPLGATVEQVNKLRDWNEHVLFHKLGPFLKAQAYLLEYKHLVGKNSKQLKTGKTTLDDLAKIAADLVTDDFGGLHLKRKGRNPTLQHIFHLLALAPDWTESNIRSALEAFRGGKRGNAYRAFWARIAAKGLLAVILFNYIMAMFDEDDEETEGTNERFIRNYKQAWEDGQMRWMDVNVTPLYKSLGGKADKRKYFALIGHFKDPIKFVARETIKEGPLKGFPDPLRSLIKSAKYKGSVLTRIFADGITGKNWAGREFTSFSELLGVDDKGEYVTSRRGWYKKGDPKGGKLKGELTKWSMGGVKPLGLDQVPSFLIYEARNNMPIQVQNAISYLVGQMDGFDASLKSAGVYIHSTYDPAERLTKNLSLEELKQLRLRYVYSSTSRIHGRIKGRPHKGKEAIVAGIDRAIREKE